MAASRRTVTVLFCDVVDWTTLGAALDAEVLRERQTRYHEEARTVLERHGGTVEKFIGDAVMAVFGWPAVREDDALRAVRAAAELRTRLEGLRVRIGVNTGEVAAGAGDALVTGEAVNLAKRLEQAADAGKVLVGEATRALVAGAVELAPVTPLALKGLDERVHAWQLVEVLGDARPYARRLDVPFVGRADELGRLEQELERARKGCRLVTVLGPPGIGKSRLAFELVELVRGTATVLNGRCLPYGDGITFWPLAEALREAGREDVLADAAADELFWRVRAVFEELAADRPLLLVFEDIHWGEPTFLDLLEYLAGWSPAPILVVCLARPEVYERRPDWPREATIALDPLPPAEAELLVSALAEELDAETRRRIGEIAEGNPLFAEQLSAAAQEGELTVPPSIQALLAARLDRLSAEERAAVERAAVIGREFTAGEVSELAGEQRRSTLLALVRKELVRPAGGEDRFAFRHILIRDAAYATIPKRVRAELHERVAAFSETDELAGYHLEQAYRYGAELGEAEAGLAARAAVRLGAAGVRAHDRMDMPAAITLLDRALELGDRSDPTRPELLRRLAGALWTAGEIGRSGDLLTEALGAAEQAGDRLAEWHLRLEQAAQRWVAGPEALDELRDVASQAIEVFEELADDLGLARAWARLALASLHAGQFGTAEHEAEQALAYALRAGAQQEAARSVDLLSRALLHGPARVAYASERCRALLETTGSNKVLEANGRAALAGLEAMQGNFDQARALIDEAGAIYREREMRLYEAGLAQAAGDVELQAGDPVAAERIFRASLEILHEVGNSALAAVSELLLASSLYAQGRYEEAAQLVGAAEQGSEGWTRMLRRSLEARLAARAGDFELAVELAREADGLAASIDSPVMQADAAVAQAEVYRLAGRAREAEQALARAIDLHESKGSTAGARLARQPA